MEPERDRSRLGRKSDTSVVSQYCDHTDGSSLYWRNASVSSSLKTASLKSEVENASETGRFPPSMRPNRWASQAEPLRARPSSASAMSASASSTWMRRRLTVPLNSDSGAVLSVPRVMVRVMVVASFGA